MFAAECGAEIRNHNADVIVREMERPGQFALVAKRALRAGPDGQFSFGPFSDSSPRFKWCMLGVRHLVGLAQHFFRAGKLLSEGVLWHAALNVFFQVAEQ